ncbi:MAG TPA: twin-arginine translocation signal domain-containing protein, partial [Cyclobacteriaceae bacterium]|nr:twin-arginine translocation signal domain-containing protein [Cyclobacteriaceae bacterium]
MKNNKTSRREFVKKSSLLAGSLVALPAISNAEFFHASADDTIKIALVGCGGRGTGAALQALLTKQNVKLVA